MKLFRNLSVIHNKILISLETVGEKYYDGEKLVLGL